MPAKVFYLPGRPRPEWFLLWLWLACLAGCAVHEHPADTAPAFGQTVLDWRGKQAPGAVVVLDNPYGNIRVRTSPYGDLTLRAVVQNMHPAIGEARLVERYDKGRIEVALEADGLDPAVDRRRFRADFTLSFPENLGLEVHLTEGNFQMHASDAPVTVRAVRGDIRLITTGPVDVELLSGTVDYRPPANRGTPAGGRIQASDAEVNLIVPGYRDMAFRVISGVTVTTDSSELLEARRVNGREEIMRMSEDARELFIQTDSGPIRIVTAGHL